MGPLDCTARWIQPQANTVVSSLINYTLQLGGRTPMYIGQTYAKRTHGTRDILGYAMGMCNVYGHVGGCALYVGRYSGIYFNRVPQTWPYTDTL